MFLSFLLVVLRFLARLYHCTEARCGHHALSRLAWVGKIAQRLPAMPLCTGRATCSRLSSRQ